MTLKSVAPMFSSVQQTRDLQTSSKMQGLFRATANLLVYGLWQRLITSVVAIWWVSKGDGNLCAWREDREETDDMALTLRFTVGLLFSFFILPHCILASGTININSILAGHGSWNISGGVFQENAKKPTAARSCNLLSFIQQQKNWL